MNRVWGEAHRDASAEWLEADGLGGYASGCASGIRTRRYHALLLAALTPPTGRHVFVNDVEVAVVTAACSHALSSHRYVGDVIHPEGAARITSFSADPWPSWRFRTEDGDVIEYEIVVPHRAAGVL